MINWLTISKLFLTLVFIFIMASAPKIFEWNLRREMEKCEKRSKTKVSREG